MGKKKKIKKLMSELREVINAKIEYANSLQETWPEKEYDWAMTKGECFAYNNVLDKLEKINDSKKGKKDD